MKCLTDTVDSARSVAVDPERVSIVMPGDFERPEGLHIGWQNLPLAVEKRLYQQRLPAVQAFVRANGLDRWSCSPGPGAGSGSSPRARPTSTCCRRSPELGIDEERAQEIGLSIYKVAMSWPLEPVGVRHFAEGLEDVLVVEEKRPLIEEQLARLLYNSPSRPRLSGKTDERGAPLVPADGELNPQAVEQALRGWLERRVPELAATLAGAATPSLRRLPRARSRGCRASAPAVRTTPRRWCPTTSVALGGIGCHGMAVWLPERHTLAVTQMGGEGANWIGAAPFTETATRLPEYWRRHLLPLRPARDPRRGRRRGAHHVQDPGQRRGRHDRRPADRGRAAGRARSRFPRSRASSTPRACAGSPS